MRTRLRECPTDRDGAGTEGLPNEELAQVAKGATPGIHLDIAAPNTTTPTYGCIAASWRCPSRRSGIPPRPTTV